MPSGLGANFDRAQAMYENRLPDDDEVPTEECDECEGTGKIQTSACCDAEVQNNICMECNEACELSTCDKCLGKGEVEIEPPEPDFDCHEND